MSIEFSKNLFGKLSVNSDYYLADLDQRLPLFYGIDNKGHYSLIYQTERLRQDISGTKILDVSTGRIGNDEKYVVSLSLLDNDFKSVFFSLCDDIFSVLNNISDNESGYLIFIDRIKKWKKMFSRKTPLLTEPIIQGLYGELYFLDNYMFQKYGMEKAIKAWGGPQGMSKDFSIGLDWYEVKCINAQKDKVIISSAQQLDSENPGTLVVIKTEYVPEGFDNGIATINKLFWKIKKELSSLPGSEELFMDCLSKRDFAPNEEYDKWRFNVTHVDYYNVDSDFPRITPSNEQKSAIGKITYELILDALKKYTKEGK